MFSTNSVKTIILVGGEGGHMTQLNRIRDLINQDVNIIVITDDVKICGSLPKCDSFFKLGTLREKSGFNLRGIAEHISSAFQITKHLRKKDRLFLISTGPSVSIVPAIITRLLGGKVLHIETWSRFYSRSMTGKLMYWLANYFWYQNKSLSDLYPKGKYCGRL